MARPPVATTAHTARHTHARARARVDCHGVRAQVTLFVATVIAFMVTYSVKDPVKASLEKSWPKVGPTFIDYCHNKAIAAGEVGTCTTYTSPFKLVNLTTNKEKNEKRAAEVCDGKCRTTLITEAQDKQAIMRYAAWALTILLFVHFMYNTVMKMKTGELAVTEVDEFGARAHSAHSARGTRAGAPPPPHSEDAADRGLCGSQA